MNFPNHFKDYFHPEKLHQINVSFAVDSLAKHLGGCSTNIAYALRNTADYFANTKSKTLNSNQTLNLKGLQNSDVQVCPVGAVGKDGGELLTFFKENNIDTSNILKDKKLYTATGKVITDQNDNQIWGFYYGACSLNLKLENLNPNQIKQNPKSINIVNPSSLVTSHSLEFWILSATHERPFTTALKHVIKNKLPYLFDPGMTLTWIRDDLLKKGVLNAAYLIGNDYEIAMIEKRLKMTVAQMVEKGVNVIVTLGEKGVRYYGSTDSASALLPANAPLQRKSARVSGMPLRPSHLFRHDTVKAIKLRKVVDPTGAGDAWRGGFVGALVSGKNLRECLVMGNVMASFAVETMGTVEYVAKREDIEKRVKSLRKL